MLFPMCVCGGVGVGVERIKMLPDVGMLKVIHSVS